MKMEFEMLLNVYLTWKLLLKQVIRLLGHLCHAMRLCSRCRVKGEAGSACRIGQVVNISSRHHIRCKGRLHRQIGRDRWVGQGGARSGSCRERNNWRGRAGKREKKIDLLC